MCMSGPVIIVAGERGEPRLNLLCSRTMIGPPRRTSDPAFGRTLLAGAMVAAVGIPNRLAGTCKIGDSVER